MNRSYQVFFHSMPRISFLSVFLVFYAQFVLGQISSQVVFKEHAGEEPEFVEIRWSEADKRKWDDLNEGRLENMGVKVNIHSGDLPLAQSAKSTFRFLLDHPYHIEVLLDILDIFPGEQLKLVDIRSGETLFEIPTVHQRKILTPAFDPETTIFVWTHEANKPYLSTFTIENLYLQEHDNSRGRGIGFGTALACHPNAACKQDSMLKLISNSAVRIRMVMEEGIGWCSGSFVNNTRNDKSPLVLTAYHCTFHFTPHFDLWRFDLQYKSDSCANPPLEPDYFSLTGCQLKASGQGSDFLLVLLDNNLPVNQAVTFAGWNRDEVALPDTLYLVHHPNADIRKLSTCTGEAVIHPNQIGWSEGYNTPANHHLRFKFTEGGHQPGSSGGPVFNEDGLFIGQLHGGSMGCEDVNTAYSGRLAKSWNYGVTEQERLKDWLDPDQSGVVQWPSIENIQQSELIDIQGTVVDPLGRPVKNVEVGITGSSTKTLLTDNEGRFNLPRVNRQGQYTITAGKNDYQTNGINVIDLIAIQKHLLAKDTFDLPWQYIAADATNNNLVSVGDILVLLRLLLGKISFLPTSPSWRFSPPEFVLENLPIGEPARIQFQAIKIGDLNNSVNPLK